MSFPLGGDQPARIDPTATGISPADNLDPGPQYIPNEQVSAHVPPGSLQAVGRSDRDNFVTDMVTIPTGAAVDTSSTCDQIIVAVTPSSAGRPPLLSLDEVKLWLRIEPDQTSEDDLLQVLEIAAHAYTENYLRQILDPNAAGGIGEHILVAQRLLIAHWYRNREAVSTGSTMMGDVMPLGYAALLSADRDYPCIY
jgi:hypothetical protein